MEDLKTINATRGPSYLISAAAPSGAAVLGGIGITGPASDPPTFGELHLPTRARFFYPPPLQPPANKYLCRGYYKPGQSERVVLIITQIASIHRRWAAHDAEGAGALVHGGQPAGAACPSPDPRGGDCSGRAVSLAPPLGPGGSEVSRLCV